MNENYSGGLLWFQYWYRNADGFMSGTQKTPASNTTLHAQLIDTLTQTDLAVREIVVQPLQGADDVKGYMGFGSTGLNPFTLTTTSSDGDDVAFVHGTAVDEATNTYYPMMTYFTNASKMLDLGIMVTQQYQDRDGTAKYGHMVIPHCRALVRKVHGGYQVVDSYIWGIRPLVTTKNFFGTSFSDLNMDTLKDEMDHYIFKTDYPVALSAYVGDGIETTFNVKYKPISTVVTLNATPNWFNREATDLALTSLTLAGLATMPSVGSDGDYNQLAYQTEFSLV